MNISLCITATVKLLGHHCSCSSALPLTFQSLY